LNLDSNISIDIIPYTSALSWSGPLKKSFISMAMSTVKGVGRKISRGGPTEKKTKNRKKHQKVAL